MDKKSTSDTFNEPYVISGLQLLNLVPKLLRNPLPTLVKLSEKHGNLLTFDGGKYQKLHVVSDPKIVKHLLKSNAANYLRSPVINALTPLLGNGIFISEGEAWKRQHSMLKPALHETHIKTYLKIVESEVAFLLTKWKKQNGMFEVEPFMEEMMLRILVKSVFGFEQELDWKQIISSHKIVIEEVGIERQKLDFFKKKFFGIKRTAGQIRFEKNVEYLRFVVDEIVREMNKNQWPLMRYMLNEDASKEEQIDMVLNLLFAGYDTTASALSWAIYCLSKHPEWQHKIVEETASENSTSIKMVIQESMRLYPPVWSLLRLSIEDDEIHGWKLPADSYLMINVNSLHRNPQIWEHPNQFYPQHFESEQLKGKAFAYIPFGQGQRMCIGKPLAMQEMELILPKLLNHFIIHADDLNKKELRIKPDIIVKSQKGIRVKVEPRG